MTLPAEDPPRNRRQIPANQDAGQSSATSGRQDASSPTTSSGLAERGRDKETPQYETSEDDELADRNVDYDLDFLTAPTNRERRAVWMAANRWSLAAAVYAKGLEAERWQPLLQEAQEAAGELALTLPPFPSAESPADLVDAVTKALRGESGDEPEGRGRAAAQPGGGRRRAIGDRDEPVAAELRGQRGPGAVGRRKDSRRRTKVVRR